jgi:hypothetical protein
MELNSETCTYARLSNKRVFYDENDKKFYLDDNNILNFSKPILYSLSQTSDERLKKIEKELEEKLLNKYKH